MDQSVLDEHFLVVVVVVNLVIYRPLTLSHLTRGSLFSSEVSFAFVFNLDKCYPED